MIDLFVSTQVGQSASLKPIKCIRVSLLNWRPWFREPSMYLKTLLAEPRWDFVGWAVNWLSCWVAKIMSGWIVVR